MKQLNNNQRRAVTAMRNSGGRFFGLYTTQGEAINAQFRSDSPRYVEVYDRNNFQTRKLAKTSIARVSLV